MNQKHSIINQSFKHWNVQKLNQSIMVQCFKHQTIVDSFKHWMVESLDCSVSQSFSHSAIQSFSHSIAHTIQTINHWIEHSIIPSVTEPNNQEASTSTSEIFFDESGGQKTMIQLFNKSFSQRLKLGHRYSGEFVSVSQLGQVVDVSKKISWWLHQYTNWSIN